MCTVCQCAAIGWYRFRSHTEYGKTAQPPQWAYGAPGTLIWMHVSHKNTTVDGSVIRDFLRMCLNQEATTWVTQTARQIQALGRDLNRYICPMSLLSFFGFFFYSAFVELFSSLQSFPRVSRVLNLIFYFVVSKGESSWGCLILPS